MRLYLSQIMLGLVCMASYLLLVFVGELGFVRGAAHMAPIATIIRHRALGNGPLSRFIRRRSSPGDPFDEAVDSGKSGLGFYYGYTRTCTGILLILFPPPPARQAHGMSVLMLSCILIPARADVVEHQKVVDDAALASSAASRKAIGSLLEGYVDRHGDRTSCEVPGHYVLGVYGCPAQFGMF